MDFPIKNGAFQYVKLPEVAVQAVAFFGLLLGRFILQLVEQGLTAAEMALELTPQRISSVGKRWEDGEQSML